MSSRSLGHQGRIFVHSPVPTIADLTAFNGTRPSSRSNLCGVELADGVMAATAGLAARG